MNAPEMMKRQRQRLGLTQAQVAQKAGISREGYYSIERGVRKGRPSTIFAISQVLEIPTDALIDATDFSPNQPAWWPTEKAYALCRKASA